MDSDRKRKGLSNKKRSTRGVAMLTKTKIGMPVISTSGVLGRIVKFPEDALCMREVYSHVIFSTPHGTVISVGIFHLQEAKGSDLEKLEQLEESAKKALKGDPLYHGYDIGLDFCFEDGLGHA
jgi:hypothetical protein